MAIRDRRGAPRRPPAGGGLGERVYAALELTAFASSKARRISASTWASKARRRASRTSIRSWTRRRSASSWFRLSLLILTLSAGPAAAESLPVLWVRGGSVYVPASGLAAGDRLVLLDTSGVRRGEAVIRRAGPDVAVGEWTGAPPGRGWTAWRTGAVGAAGRGAVVETAPPPAPSPPPPPAPPAAPAAPSPSSPPIVRAADRPAPAPFARRWVLEGLPLTIEAIAVAGDGPDGPETLVVWTPTEALAVPVAGGACRAAPAGLLEGLRPAGLEANLDGDVWRAGDALVRHRIEGGLLVEAGRTGPLGGRPVGLAAARIGGRAGLVLAVRRAGGVDVEVLVGR